MSAIVFYKHQRQHLAPDGRHRKPHRGEGMTAWPPAPRLSDRQRINWLRLIRTRQCRPGNVPRPDQPLRLGRSRARNAARAGDLAAAPSAASRIPSRRRSGSRARSAQQGTAPRFVAHRRARLSADAEAHGPAAAAPRGQGRAGRVRAAARRHRRRAQRLAGRHQDSRACSRGDLGRQGYAIISGPGARHRHGRASGQPRDRHGRRAGRRARPALPARKCRPLRRDRRGAAARQSPKCRSAGSRAPRIFRAATG